MRYAPITDVRRHQFGHPADQHQAGPQLHRRRARRQDVRLRPRCRRQLHLSGRQGSGARRPRRPPAPTMPTARSLDPNGAAYGISNDEVKHNIKYDVDLRSRLLRRLQDQHRRCSAKPASAVRTATRCRTRRRGRSPCSARSASGTRYLLYVPTGVERPARQLRQRQRRGRCSTTSSTRSGLTKYRGKIAPRNAFNSKWFTKLRSAPVAGDPDRSSATVAHHAVRGRRELHQPDQQELGPDPRIRFPYTIAPVTATCLTTPVATGVRDHGRRPPPSSAAPARSIAMRRTRPRSSTA